MLDCFLMKKTIDCFLRRNKVPKRALEREKKKAKKSLNGCYSRMKSSKAEDTPNAEEANYADNETCWRLFDGLNKRPMSLVTLSGEKDEMCHCTSENEDAM